MRNRDFHDAMTTIMAIIADMVVIWVAHILAVWIRFFSGWIPRFGDYDASKSVEYGKYALASSAALLIYLAVFQILKLYSRPQDGRFSGKVPRLMRAVILSGCGSLVVTALLKNVIDISNTVILVAFGTVSALLLVERFIMFRLEILLARKARPCHTTIIIGVNDFAARIAQAALAEPRMRTRIAGFVEVNGEEVSPSIPKDMILGGVDALEKLVAEHEIDQLVLASHKFTHDETVDIVVFCEQHLIRFSLIPDLFRMMTTKAEFQMVGNVPVLGIGRWPLDQVWNRMNKRILDIVGSFFGLLVSFPIILIASIFIKAESKGPVFYGQDRCGRGGSAFRIYKLRTMRNDAESGGKPGWTVGDDPRRTRIGAFLRKYNIDELPQFWNVLKGEMSLVGPRPERPYFVEQFTPGIEHYMWRHVSKPGLTGWAQVNGLRGDTSISERVKYDLYYLENWSLSFDLKIMLRTLFTYKNAC